MIKKFTEVLEKFMSYGASGFQLKGAATLLVDAKFENESIRNPDPKAVGYLHTNYGFYSHSKTENVPDLGLLLQKWRIVVKNNTENGPFMVSEDLVKAESYKVNHTLVVDLPVQSRLFTRSTLNATDTVKGLQSIFTYNGINWPLWKVAK